jgi:Tol biopolymer transport system component
MAKGDGSDAKQITSGQNLGFHLFWVGEQFAAANFESDWFRMNLDGSEIAPLFNDRELRSQMSACADGKHIVYNTVRNGSAELWSSDVDGANAVKITDRPLFATASCSPDSKSAMYAADDGMIWRSPISGGTAEKTNLPLAFFGFSSDGKTMFYNSQEIEAGTIHPLLVVTPAYDPKTILHKLDAPYGLQSPKFTPDGKAIAFLLTRNRATNIWKAPLSGSAPSVLTKFPTGDMFGFSWSRDGRKLAFSRGQQKTDVILMSNFR